MKTFIAIFAVAMLACGSLSADVYVDTDWESGDEGFIATGTWTRTSTLGLNPGANSGSFYWFASDDATVSSDFLESPVYTMPATQIDLTMEVTHRYEMENTFDGGVIEVNVNGGGWVYVPSPDVPDYDAAISTGFSSPIAGLEAYTGQRAAYATSVIDLSNFVSGGDSFQVRFHQADDASVSADGWYVDDLKIFSIPEPGSIGLLALLGVGLIVRRRK